MCGRPDDCLLVCIYQPALTLSQIDRDPRRYPLQLLQQLYPHLELRLLSLITAYEIRQSATTTPDKHISQGNKAENSLINLAIIQILPMTLPSQARRMNQRP